MKIFLIILVLGLVSCKGEIEVNNKLLINKGPVYSSIPTKPQGTTISMAGNLTEELEQFITLGYTDANGDQALTCVLSSLVNLNLSTACSCVAGICSVGVTGFGQYTGVASFDYSVNDGALDSDDSTVSLNIVDKVITCPNGFVEVESNSDLGVSDFCIMIYEAKNVGGHATSQAGLAPWSSISATNAKAACTALGTGYDMISNAEWMTTARDLEAGNSNWSGGVVGSGCIKKGNTGNNNTCEYNGPDPEFGSTRNSKSLLTLSNGGSIWDFAGNVSEYVDWITGGGFDEANACDSPFTNLMYFDCGSLLYEQYRPLNPAGLAPYNETHGIGRYGASTFMTGSTAKRGGNYASSANAGIFYMYINGAVSQVRADVGFRCVYRP